VLDNILKQDLEKCDGFGGVVKHTRDNLEEELNYLCFDRYREVTQNGAFENVETTMPTATFITDVAKNIDYSSILSFSFGIFLVVEVEHKADFTTTVYLETV
jgi:hypothetical protein